MTSDWVEGVTENNARLIYTTVLDILRATPGADRATTHEQAYEVVDRLGRLGIVQ